MGLTVGINILKQLIARQVLAAADDASKPCIAQVNGMILAALAAKVEVRGFALNVYVLVVQGSQAERLVFSRIGFVADADMGFFQEAHDGGQHLLAGQAVPGKVGVYHGADAGEGLAERDHAPVFGFIAHGTPLFMVSVLLASSGIVARGLQVAVRLGANPDIFVGRGKG